MSETMSETTTTAAAPEHRWYIIHTYSGYEGKVRESLLERMSAAGFGDRVSEVLVPSEEIVELKRGKRRVAERKIFPGYVLVKMALSDETWHLVQETPRITGFVGGRTHPTPLTDAEVQAIVDQTKSEDGKAKPGQRFRVGENVRVVDGPFTNFVGVVDHVNEERFKLRVMVSIFGRSTPVELEFLQVEKL